MYPDSIGQIGVFVLFVLPGITFSTVRVALVGWRAPDYGVGSRVLDALFASAIFDSLYVLIFGWYVADVVAGRRDPVDDFNWVEALVAVLLLLVLPAIVAALISLRLRIVHVPEARVWARWRLRATNNYRSVPLAWDKVAGALDSGQWVRVRAENGTPYGGWFSGRSYVSTYPQPRDIYIEVQYRMSEIGEFVEAIPGSRGVWLPITDRCVVEWIDG